MTSEVVNGEMSEGFIEEDWSNLLTWPLSRRRSSNESHHLLLNGNLYTPYTLLFHQIEPWALSSFTFKSF